MQHEGEALRLKIKGTGYTVEQAAEILGISKRTLQYLYKDAVIDAASKQILKEKMQIDFAENVQTPKKDLLKGFRAGLDPNNTDLSYAAESTPTYGNKTPSNLPQEAVLKLIDANKDASKANLVHAEARLVEAENNKQLISMVKATASAPVQSQPTDLPILYKVQELLIDVLTGKQFQSREEAMIEVYKLFGGSAPLQG